MGAKGFASDAELYAEKARKPLESNIAAKQLESRENAARFRPGSAGERSAASTLAIRPASRNHAKKLRQMANKKQAGEDYVEKIITVVMGKDTVTNVGETADARGVI